MKQFFFSIDFGGLSDYTANAIIERELNQEQDPYGREYHQVENPKYFVTYKIRYLDRFPMHERFPDTVEKIAGMLMHPNLYGKTAILIDATANVSGRQMLEDRLRGTGCGMPIGIWVTTGREAKESSHGYNVPKAHLASALNAVYQSRRIKVPYDLPYRKDLEKELEHFEPKRLEASGNITYEAAKESVHDDLVMALAMPIWYCEKIYGATFSPSEKKHSAKTMKDPLRS